MIPNALKSIRKLMTFSDTVPVVPSCRTRWSHKMTVDIMDAAAVGATLMAGGTTLLWSQAAEFNIGSPVVHLQLYIAGALLCHIILKEVRRWKDQRKAQQLGAMAEGLTGFALVFATALAILQLFSHGVVIEQPLTTPSVVVWWAVATALVTIAQSALRRRIETMRKSGTLVSNVAVFGNGRIADEIKTWAARDASTIRLIGVYDDRSRPEEHLDPGETAGDIEALIAAGRNDLIDEIVIALPPSADGRLSHIVRRLEHLPVRIRICTHLATDIFTTHNHTVSNLGQVGLLDVKARPMAGWAPAVKRAMDLAIAVPALVVAGPIMVMAALAIKLETGGPILFRQRRHGLNHRVFWVYKFRSMTVCEDGAHVEQAKKSDARITRVGWVLRRTSLDELPQILNVIRGDMSLVGPRPHALVHNEYYGELLERYANRHQVKPGITGWAQVNGHRGETSTPDAMRQRVQHDLHYIDHWSPWLDLRIIFATPIYGLLHRNAF